MSTSNLTWLNAYWGLWLAMFLVPELYWLFTNARYTLSETVWTLENLNTSQPFDFPMWTDLHWALACLVWALFLWLSLHLPFGMLR
jgi:hypothetical protein